MASRGGRLKRAFASVAISLFLMSVGIGCVDDSSSGNDVEYKIETGNMVADSIRFERWGGGAIEFTINDTIGFYRVWLRRMGYRDTSLALRVQKGFADSLSRNFIGGLLHGTANISGVIYKNELATGTWSYLYIHSGSKWIRVANDDAIDAISGFESSLDSLLNESSP